MLIAREFLNGHVIEVLGNEGASCVRIDGVRCNVGNHNDGFRVGFSFGDSVLEAARNHTLALTETQLTIRRDFMDMSPEERSRLADALNQLWNSGLIQKHADFHDTNFLSGIHWGPTFLPWHRYFLRRLEKALQAIDPGLYLPFWDWTRDDSRSLDDEPWLSFFGGRRNRNGNFDHWTYRRTSIPTVDLPTLNNVISELAATNYTDFRKMEGGTHVPGHNWVGGDMATGRSPIDPIFYFHHCNLDRIWAIWQKNNSGVNQYDITGRIPTDSIDERDGSIDSRVRQDEAMKGIENELPTPGAYLDCTLVGHGYAQDDRLERLWSEVNNSQLDTEISLE